MPDRDLWEIYLPAVDAPRSGARAGARPRAPPLPGRVRAADRRHALLARPPSREDRRPGPLLRRDGAGLPGGPGPELRREDRPRGGRGAPRGPLVTPAPAGRASIIGALSGSPGDTPPPGRSPAGCGRPAPVPALGEALPLGLGSARRGGERRVPPRVVAGDHRRRASPPPSRRSPCGASAAATAIPR